MSEGKKGSIGKGRSRLLYQITFLLVVVLVVIGIALFLVVNGALNRLIDEDKQDRINTEAEIIYNDSSVLADIRISQMMTDFPELDIADLIVAINEERINDFIGYANDSLRETVEQGMLGAEALSIVDLNTQGFFDGPFVLAASDETLTFAEVPEYIVDAFEDGEHFIYKEEGIYDWGFEGEYLITLIPLQDPVTSEEIVLTAIRPFGEEVAHIDDFYSRERNRLNLILALVMGGGIILVFLITFFILRRMIYRQITRPIDELAGVAEEVMDGNLDVEIDIREGEEFETLKRAFREMVKSIRTVIEQSIGKQD